MSVTAQLRDRRESDSEISPTIESPHRSDPSRWWARGFGAMFLAGGVANLVLLSVSANAYDSFADASYWRSSPTPGTQR